MDKLQPIIKQRFWILLGLSLILAFFAFFKNQSAIVAATTQREEALKATLAAVPSGSEANQVYVDGLTKINTDYKAKIDQAVDELFASQQARMTWPEQIAKELPRDPKGIPLYRDKEKPLGTVATRTYAKIYKDLIEEVWKRAEPVVEKYIPATSTPGGIGGPGRTNELLRGIQSGTMRPRGNPRTNKFLRGQTIMYDHPGQPRVTWAQKVYIDRQAIPQKVLPPNAIPSAEQVWDCQEDIWFTDLILEAVRKVNKDADNVLTSPLKVISKIELHGGAGAGATAAAAGMEGMEGAEAGADAGAMGMGMGSGSLGGSGMGEGALGAGGAAAPPPTEFDPAEVFGPEAVAGAASSDGSAGAEESADGGMGMGMGMAAMPQALRWVALTDGAKFRERGFYLSVIINQQKIPDFLVHLCESAWPTKVLKFQMGPNPYRKDGASAAMMGGYMPGFEGSGGAYGESGGGYGNFGGLSSMGSSAGMSEGMMGMGMGGFGMVAANRYPGGPPQFAFSPRDPFNGSLNQPDLVQLDIAGIITFYVSAAAAAETTAAAAVDTPSAPGGEQGLLEEAAKQAEEAKKAESTQPGSASEGTTPMPATAPATTPPAGETPAAPATAPPAATDGTVPQSPAPPAGESPPAATPPAAAAETPPPAAAPQTPAAPGT
jgi:hypothetical protein